jgi:hypothetical protein
MVNVYFLCSITLSSKKNSCQPSQHRFGVALPKHSHAPLRDFSVTLAMCWICCLEDRRGVTFQISRDSCKAVCLVLQGHSPAPVLWTVPCSMGGIPSSIAQKRNDRSSTRLSKRAHLNGNHTDVCAMHHRDEWGKRWLRSQPCPLPGLIARVSGPEPREKFSRGRWHNKLTCIQ